MKTEGKYILNADGNPEQEMDLIKWAEWFEKNYDKRMILQTQIEKGWWIFNNETILVSTVFLGIDSNFSEIGKPLLFETMVFGGKYDNLLRRYSTIGEAILGHHNIIKNIKS